MLTIKDDSILNADYEFCAKQKYMQCFAGKKVMVIGATGMLGTYIINVLCTYNTLFPKKACQIIALARGNTKKEFDNDNVFYIKADITTCKTINLDFDFCIFAAGYTDHRLYTEKPIDIYSVNTIGLHNALEMARLGRCKRFLFISSSSVYGSFGTNEIKENETGLLTSLDYKSVYQESKRMGECICSSFSKQYGMTIKVVRPFHMYGPGMTFNNSNMVNVFIENLVNKKNIVMYSTGEVLRNFTYLRDIIWQLFLVFLKADVFDVYNLGSKGNNYRVKDFAEHISRIAGIDIEYKIQSGNNPTNLNSYCPNLERINKLNTEHIETVTLKNGLLRCLNYWS